MINFTEPLFPHLENEDNSIYLTELSLELNEGMRVLEPAGSKCLINVSFMALPHQN